MLVLVHVMNALPPSHSETSLQDSCRVRHPMQQRPQQWTRGIQHRTARNMPFVLCTVATSGMPRLSLYAAFVIF